ncbi:NYN domain protein [Corynebacterium pseudopelargi]|uniref:NYN domain protein n=1 Tax=Corynebacterium pseudopelargi TaxID=2080757 RepID=A0A3G6IRQ8_9CORY|nr:NYN domain-containing protein [Corynebacterium pseudopelargi]AZA08275.1 NYN domain protein [Corynebacterium pseudopelargi]
MLERTQIFVDTSYLLASFYNSWETGARAQLEIDLPEVVATLATMAQNHLNQPVHRQLWYDGIPDSGPHRYQRSLRTCDGVQLRAGQLIEWGDRRTQKAVDTRLVADLVLSGVRREFTDVILVSGDADMIPGVQEAVANGVRVHLYGFGWDSMSSALRQNCDSTTILDPREDFAECMQLEVLEGPLPPVVRLPEEDEDAQEQPKHPHDAEPPHETDRPGPQPDDAEEHEQQAGPTPGPSAQPGPGAQPGSGAQPGPGAQRPQAQQSVKVDQNAQVVEAEPLNSEQEAEEQQPIINAEPMPETDKEAEEQEAATRSSAPKPSALQGDRRITVTSKIEESVEVTVSSEKPRPAPNPSMMAPRRKLRSRYVPLPNEVWASAGYQTPFDVGQQYARWWYENAATTEQRDSAHLLSGGGLPPEIDRPLLQFACETLHEYTLTESQRVGLRDGFHSGIRGVLLNNNGG